MFTQKNLKIGKAPFSALSGRNTWKMALKIGDVFPLTFTLKSGYQVIAPILAKYDGQIIEIEKDENRNMCSWCTLYTFIHLCYTTVVFNTRFIITK